MAESWGHEGDNPARVSQGPDVLLRAGGWLNRRRDGAVRGGSTAGRASTGTSCVHKRSLGKPRKVSYNPV